MALGAIYILLRSHFFLTHPVLQASIKTYIKIKTLQTPDKQQVRARLNNDGLWSTLLTAHRKELIFIQDLRHSGTIHAASCERHVPPRDTWQLLCRAWRDSRDMCDSATLVTAVTEHPTISGATYYPGFKGSFNLLITIFVIWIGAHRFAASQVTCTCIFHYSF